MLRVAIVDDQKVVTQGLKVLLGAEPDIEIVGTGSNGCEAIDLVAHLIPDVLLIDLHMPIMNGVEATRNICHQFPSVAVLLLSGSDQDNYITDALQAGAKGYLLKSTSAEDLANSIRSVHRGYSQIGPGLLEKLLAKVNNNHNNDEPPTLQPTTNPLETELIQLLRSSDQFDLVRIKRILANAKDPKTAAELMTRLEKQLQETPTHVSALYLSGRLIDAFQRHSYLVMNYLRLAFSHAQAQGLSLSVLLHIANAAWLSDSTETWGWLRQLLQDLPPEQSTRPFLTECVQIFGETSEPYRLIRVAWEMKQLNYLCDQTNALKSRLATLSMQGT
jgi:DNA-binding NarL/FixJ family response regulator